MPIVTSEIMKNRSATKANTLFIRDPIIYYVILLDDISYDAQQNRP
jgi:hypothetical protein